MHNDRHASNLPWHLKDLDLSPIDTARLRERDDIFLLVCSASFVESGAETYTRNLVNYFADDTEISAWLIEHWEPEELQHGRALKAYVQHVWHEFDWNGAYNSFFAEYRKLCTIGELESSRGRELAARCIVEMGTTTYYQALSAVCDEPVLRNLALRIRSDEIRHYKHFYHYFLRYRQQENLHRPQVMAALWRRVAELRKSDADIALRHAVTWRFRGLGQQQSHNVIGKKMYTQMSAEYPFDLAVRMALKPLRLNALLQRWIEAPIATMARRFLLH